MLVNGKEQRPSSSHLVGHDGGGDGDDEEDDAPKEAV